MAKKKILVIDDEKDFCQLTKMNLEASGEFEVTTAISGSEGINLARKYRPDLILLDIIMPGMDGAVVADELTHDETTKDTPIVFLTAVVRKKEVTDNKGVIGTRQFIAKPVTKEELLVKIRTLLNK
ncbi:MAG: response regulator [Candidatus Omnitrophota bacterium]|nr:response regulator [Candidatus Omnitrophota bacterium]